MNNLIIKIILYINKKYFFKKKHPFNAEKNGVLNINYSDFEYSHAKACLDMYSSFISEQGFRNKKILEVWCGWGGKSIYIAEKYNAEVKGIDLNQIFLDQAKEKAKELNVENKTDFLYKDALNTGFDSNSFDIIILSDVIEHIPSTQKLLDECIRILKKWGIILFDFAPYYHYFGHHLWDTIQIPWLHVFTSESFRIKLYKKSVEGLVDWEQRLNLRIWKLDGKESITYLNKIKRKNFEKIIGNIDCEQNVKYFMLKNMNFLSFLPLFRELFIGHIVWSIVKKK